MKHSRFSLMATLLLALPAGAWSAECDFAAMIQPVPATAKFSAPDYYLWCGTMVRADDGKCDSLTVYKAVGDKGNPRASPEFWRIQPRRPARPPYT